MSSGHCKSRFPTNWLNSDSPYIGLIKISIWRFHHLPFCDINFLFVLAQHFKQYFNFHPKIVWVSAN